MQSAHDWAAYSGRRETGHLLVGWNCCGAVVAGEERAGSEAAVGENMEIGAGFAAAAAGAGPNLVEGSCWVRMWSVSESDKAVFVETGAAVVAELALDSLRPLHD